MRLSARVGIAVVAALAIVAAAWGWHLAHRPAGARVPAWTPLPRRVQVEVFNSGDAAGAARVATQLLRHAGLDAFNSGNAGGALRGMAHNRILVRRGDTTGVGRIVAVLGGAVVIAQSDSTRLVDLSVYLGKDFATAPDRDSPKP